MLKQSFLIMVLIAVLNMGTALAQVPAEELTSPQKTLSCSDLVTAQSVIEGSELAFTGLVIKRHGPYTWFRVYAVHKGEYKDRLIKTAGFHGGKHFVAGTGQSFDVGEIYTVAVRRPSSRHEENIGADYVNALDSCSESVLTKAHDRYGLYRLQPAQLEPDSMDALKNYLYFTGHLYIMLLIFAFIGVGWICYRKKDQVCAFICRFKGRDEGEPPPAS